MANITNQVFSEVYDIIYHMEEEIFNKIPKGFIKMIEQNRDKNFVVNIDYSKSINSQEMQRGTRVVLSLIYRDYICSKEEREEIITNDEKELKRIEEELKEKYNLDNIFKNKRDIDEEQQKENENTEMIVYKENIIQRLFRKIKKFFQEF